VAKEKGGGRIWGVVDLPRKKKNKLSQGGGGVHDERRKTGRRECGTWFGTIGERGGWNEHISTFFASEKPLGGEGGGAYERGSEEKPRFGGNKHFLRKKGSARENEWGLWRKTLFQ